MLLIVKREMAREDILRKSFTRQRCGKETPQGEDKDSERSICSQQGGQRRGFDECSPAFCQDRPGTILPANPCTEQPKSREEYERMCRYRFIDRHSLTTVKRPIL